MEFTVNKRYAGKIAEEITRIKIEAGDINEAIDIAKKSGFEVLETNELYNTITVKGGL